MRILGIETSCDETAISLIEVKGTLKNPRFKVLSNITLSQAKLHAKYGGVFPNLAKREHAKNLIPVLKKVLEEANFLDSGFKIQDSRKIQNLKLKAILNREPELLEQFLKFIPTIKKPPIDKIAVTYGPGLEPALWVGINFAKALSVVWKIPVIPVNHMEGHIASILPLQNKGNSKSEILNSKQTQNSKSKVLKLEFPAIALLISGGHTELVLVKKWGDYKILGQTRDDAVGEVYDKVARMLGLPYPGGPYISALAEMSRTDADFTQTDAEKIQLPRPMLHSDNLDFSFSGLKTSVLYFLKGRKITPKLKKEVCRAFEDAVADVLTTKTKKALQKTRAKSLIIAGGVSANKFLRDSIKKELSKYPIPDVKYPALHIFVPPHELSTDNALMIAMAGYLKISLKKRIPKKIQARGNLSFNSKD